MLQSLLYLHENVPVYRRCPIDVVKGTGKHAVPDNFLCLHEQTTLCLDNT